MTRFIHDQFAKQYLTELLTPYGQVDTSKDITSEVRQVDLLFTATSPSSDRIESLGLLGRMAIYAKYAIFEPFRNPVSKSEIRSCMGKLFDIHADLERQGKRNNTRINEEELPYLWILTPTASEDILESFSGTLNDQNWGQGIYSLRTGLKTAIIVIHQLPITPETLFLRVLGRGKVQRQAVEELEALANNHPFLEDVIKLVHDLIALLSARQEKEKDIDQDDQELIMKLSEMYQKQLEEIKQQVELRGIDRGIQTERRAMVESILQVRFGEIDSDLARIIDQVIAISREEFTPMLLNLSREELLARFKVD
ncbi:hypothetical protein [Anabaena sp. UHCC 0451]|uniref:hypothetical protein n=1 Tax=Anabaena sp. UHCC 0451 TaxID=2055235 RepID=UPI002B2117E7|nr:hypothetical protein [Anabaena sp. UHCC 0451]MEA5576314.1 hypothetical protein [Anabaena sp. UHCC 0451]